MVEIVGIYVSNQMLTSLFTPHEVQLINKIPLNIVLLGDCLFWPRTQSGAYTVESRYNFLA